MMMQWGAVAFLCLLSGCGNTAPREMLEAPYVPTGVAPLRDTSGLTQLRINDARRSKTFMNTGLATNQDTDGVAIETLQKAFRVALNREGYRVTGQAPAALEVDLVEYSMGYHTNFLEYFYPITVTIEARVLAASGSTARKRFSERNEARAAAMTMPTNLNQTLSKTLSMAVDAALIDPEIRQAMDNAQKPAVESAPAKPAIAPPPPALLR